MSRYWVEEANGNRCIVNRPDGSWFVLEFEEMKAIERFTRRRKWLNALKDQIEYDSDSLDFDGDISEEDFIALCMEEIDSDTETYGEDWEPSVEDVVFDVAQENECWRD